MAFVLLHESGCDTSTIPHTAQYERQLSAKLNCPLSSGMGRLFDGVAAILGIKTAASYEGQGAVLLERAARDTDRCYPLAFEGLRFDWRPMVRAMAADLAHGVEIGEIAGAFHNTLCALAVEQCRRAREQSGITTVCLSGGSFQNMRLMHTLPPLLEREGFRVYHHRRVSTNDEGLSLGQLMIGEAFLEQT